MPGTLRLMAGEGVMAQILPEASNIDALENLCVVEGRAGVKADPLRRLAALLGAPKGLPLYSTRYSWTVTPLSAGQVCRTTLA